MHLAGGNKAVEEHRRHQREQHGDTTRQDKAGNQRYLQLFLFHFSTEQLLQGQHGQQRDGELSNHKDGGHRTELGVHRHIVDEEVCKAHKILSPRQEDRQNGGSQQCPFHRTFHDKQSQDEEHHHESAHIDRSTRTWLLAPILTYLLIDRQEVVFGMLHRGFALTQRH